MISAIKHITEGFDSVGVNITIRLSDDEVWQAAFEESFENVVILDRPIKIMHKTKQSKDMWKSFSESACSNEIVKVLDSVMNMFDTAPDETKRVLL